MCKPMPTKRGDFAVGVIGGKLVCAGGLGKSCSKVTDSKEKWNGMFGSEELSQP